MHPMFGEDRQVGAEAHLWRQLGQWRLSPAARCGSSGIRKDADHLPAVVPGDALQA